MCSLLTLTFIATVITMTSSSCPYVANYYYEYSDEWRVVPDSSLINDCRIANDQFNGISYGSERFTCLNNEVYINKYIGATCSGQPPFTAKLGPAPTNRNRGFKAAYSYSCDVSSPCTNAFQYVVSNNSYNAAYGTDEILHEYICLDYANDNFGYVFPIDVTGICIDTSYNVDISSRIWTCNGTGIYQFTFQGTTQCTGKPIKVKHVNAYGCSIDINLYTKMTYCNGRIYNDIPNPTTNKLPTQMPANIPSQISGNIPTQISGNIPTQISGNIPSQISGNIPTQISGNIPTQISGNIPSQISGNIPTKMPAKSPTEFIEMYLVPIVVNSNGVPIPTDPSINKLIPGYTDIATSNFRPDTDGNSTDIDIVNVNVTVPTNNDPPFMSASSIKLIWIIGVPVGGVLICVVVAICICKNSNRLNAYCCTKKRKMTGDSSSDDTEEEELK